MKIIQSIAALALALAMPLLAGNLAEAGPSYLNRHDLSDGMIDAYHMKETNSTYFRDAIRVQGVVYGNYSKHTGPSAGVVYGSELVAFGHRYQSNQHGSGTMSWFLFEPDSVKRTGYGNMTLSQRDYLVMRFMVYASDTSWSTSYFSPRYGCRAKVQIKDKDKDRNPDAIKWGANCMSSTMLNWFPTHRLNAIKRIFGTNAPKAAGSVGPEHMYYGPAFGF